MFVLAALLVCLAGSAHHSEDNDDVSYGQILRFPTQSNVSTANYLQFTPNFGKDMFEEFSVCTWIFKTYSDTIRFFLSYSTVNVSNMILLGENSDGGLTMFVHDTLDARTLIRTDHHRWNHLCFTWAGNNGWAIYVDGKQAETGPVTGIKHVKSGGLMNIGQEQDVLGGGFDANQSFAGSLYNLNIFSWKLSHHQVTKVYDEGKFCSKVPAEFRSGVMVAWNDFFKSFPRGDVVFESGEAAWRHGAMWCTDSTDNSSPKVCSKKEEVRITSTDYKC